MESISNRHASRPWGCRAVTSRVTVLLEPPAVTTWTGSVPRAAPSGTYAVMAVAVHLVNGATIPPTRTWLASEGKPNPVPATLNRPLMVIDVAESRVMLGVADELAAATSGATRAPKISSAISGE
jgi:hypothetical protein